MGVTSGRDQWGPGGGSHMDGESFVGRPQEPDALLVGINRPAGQIPQCDPPLKKGGRGAGKQSWEPGSQIVGTAFAALYCPGEASVLEQATGPLDMEEGAACPARGNCPEDNC